MSASKLPTNFVRMITLCPIYITKNKIRLMYAVKKFAVFHGIKAVNPLVMIIKTLKKRPYHAKKG